MEGLLEGLISGPFQRFTCGKEVELEDKYIILDKPEPVEEDDNKKEPTPNTPLQVPTYIYFLRTYL